MKGKHLQHSFQLEWTADAKYEGILLRSFLQENSVSRSALTDIKFKGGRIEVNEREVTVRHPIQAGDRIRLTFPPEQPSEGLIPQTIPLTIKYEDDYVLAVVKPPFMNTIPSREHPSESLANALAGYYLAKGLSSTVHIVTRLDRDTSGLLLIAKHRHIHHLLSEQQKKGLVQRRYEAIVHGNLEADKGIIEVPIGRKPTSIIEREVRMDGKYACTEFTVISRLESRTHIGLQLRTGRTHQIRVHMAYAGHPLCGDDLYGGSNEEIARQALHCCQLSFTHPITNDLITLTEPLPQDIRELLSKP
ncbi:RluA family pseudouridine synthase [Peribacillus saganii]|uniref:Pseudouridine synthase n=1 Tax=Peribacillus saganii TaxID=2303992 RepID=A0A372LLX6_9BACI|nr:RluA family pseudouridine synthase [Peribacillus saganii]RFU68010.1 RluA family pseudouridine synthase [Peribacillus saganii]